VRAAQLWDLRARAVLACLYPTMARRSELLEDLPQGLREGVVPIHSHKTAERKHRYVDGLALRCIAEWCEAADIRSGPVFRKLDCQGRVGEQPMSAQQLPQIVRASWAHRAHQQAGVAGADSSFSAVHIPDLGGHSARIGAAHDMLAAGQDLLAIMHAGGWKDPRMPRKYIKELQASVG